MKLFINDPFYVLDKIFRELYPDKDYIAQLAPRIEDENGEEVFGETCFPESGLPVITISTRLTINDAIEVFAHELAHIAATLEVGHGAVWDEIETELQERFNEYFSRKENEK